MKKILYLLYSGKKFYITPCSQTKNLKLARIAKQKFLFLPAYNIPKDFCFSVDITYIRREVTL
jgi:hypothetical protein